MTRTLLATFLGLLILNTMLPLSIASEQSSLLKKVRLIEKGVPPYFQAPGWVCTTPYGWCYLQYWQPPGSGCVCFFPYGAAQGVAR